MREPDSSVAAAFVLGGGGNLGALQVGMMYALVESGLRPAMIVGTSVGAINGAFLASRSDLPGIAEIARLWASASEPAGATSPPSTGATSLSFFVVDSGWATLQLSR